MQATGLPGGTTNDWISKRYWSKIKRKEIKNLPRGPRCGSYSLPKFQFFSFFLYFPLFLTQGLNI
jgi:hypothetical protein